MASIINAATSGGLVTTADTSGILQLQTAGTTAVTVDASQNVGINATPVNARKLTVSSAGQSDLSVVAGSGDYGQLLFGYVGADNKGIVAYNNADNSMQFYTNGTERARFNSTGALVLAGGTTSADGKGITFPATQAASTNANTLDDYEEGTWTPNIGGNATYYSQTGRYVKIGQLVYLYMYLRPLVVGTGNGNGYVYGLPFAANRSSVAVGPVLSIGYYQALGASVTSLTAGISDSTEMLILGQTAAATTNGLIAGIMVNATQIEMSGTYQATA
jgi:hypothetical protein